MATPKRAAEAIRQFKQAAPVAILRGLRAGLRSAERYAKTVFMQRKDNRHPKVWDPPNPTPGPLAIRQGNLVRTVRIGPMRYTGRTIRGGLTAGNSSVRYAAIHEFGGVAGRNYRSQIPERPYLRPALERAKPEIEQRIIGELRRLATATLRGVARVNF